MATYFHGNSEIQAGDGLQTLILMNPPGYVGYSDTQQHQHQQQHQPPGNFFFLNSSTVGHSLTPSSFTHAPPIPTHQLVGVPLHATTAPPPPLSSSQDPHPSSFHSQQDVSALHGFIHPRFQYNLYEPAAAREYTRSQQGLSLSLSPQQSGYGSFKAELKAPSPSPSQAPPPPPTDDARASPASGVSNGANGMQSVLLSSKYLKVAQELLDEVVSVGKGAKNESNKGTNGNPKTVNGDSLAAGTSSGEGLIGGGENNGAKRGTELSTAERQEIQMKKAKLVNMLDEVEQRYRQYHHQMQIVISWFEQVAGIGSAKTYTALALQTISKQFRCLKDAIAGQIRSAGKSLGEEEDCLGGGGGGKIEGSRLKFVDHHLRQQRTLQQLGMIQHNAWRPQRGLPERSVSVLRAWLFEHFLHPYPKDSDKHMLAKQTGLTRSQVSNWFINARVRLWKPMVEEMYMEEVKEHEQNGSAEKTSKSEQNNGEDSASKSSMEKNPPPTTTENPNKSSCFSFNQDHLQTTPSVSISTASTSPTGLSTTRNHTGFALIGSPEMDSSIPQGGNSPKKPRSSQMLHSPNNYSSTNTDEDGFTLMGAPTNFIGGFGSYPIGDIGRFSSEQFAAAYSGNNTGVSLTLGLPHCENLSISGTHQSFLPNQNIQLGRRVEIGGQHHDHHFGAAAATATATANTTPTSSHSANVYEGINHHNRKRFADYVA